MVIELGNSLHWGCLYGTGPNQYLISDGGIPYLCEELLAVNCFLSKKVSFSSAMILEPHEVVDDYKATMLSWYGREDVQMNLKQQWWCAQSLSKLTYIQQEHFPK